MQWTIINGETETGMSVQRLVPKGQGIDAGDIVGQMSGIVSVTPGSADLSLFRRMPRLTL